MPESDARTQAVKTIELGSYLTPDKGAVATIGLLAEQKLQGLYFTA